MFLLSTMGTYFLCGGTISIVLLDVPSELSIPYEQEAYQLGLKLQKIFNLYDPESELSQLNKKKRMRVSIPLLQVLKVALELAAVCPDYDISKGKSFLARKNGQQLEVEGNYKNILITGNQVELTSDVWIDLGSLAKGYIAQQMASYLKSQGVDSGYVDARGDLYFFGTEQEVDVQHPREDKIFCTIRVQNRGVATSGDYKQYHQDFDQSHILNQKEIISATVVCKDLTKADAFATLLMVCGIDKVPLVLKENPEMQVLLIDKHLNHHYYNNFKELVINEK